ncbi:MAG: hypothetical protein U0984_17930 [Prosthecobacter sp.]|nr:hypothetical protein [Prosthecobacter sp.]
MKFRPLILAVLAVLSLASPVRALDFANHAFFKHLIGEWKAEGELKGTDNNLVTITETWTGKADAEGSFYIEGSRTVNGETQRFKWSITHNAAIDSYEAILTGADDSQTLRFEGSLSEVTMVMTMKAITGTGGSGVTVEDSFADADRDTLESKVTLTNDQGQTSLEGKITHKRVKAP